MAAARKQGISRYLGSLTICQEEQRYLVGLTNVLQDDVQNLVEQAADRILQLRGRTVVCKTIEGCRRKKNASIDATQKAESAHPSDAQEDLKPLLVDVSVSSPSDVTGTRKQPRQPGRVHAGRQEVHESEAVQTEYGTAHGGKKRGRGQNGGQSQAKSKRVKAQTKLLTSANQLDAAGALGPSGSQQSAGGFRKAANTTDGVDVTEAAVEGQSVAEAPFVQPKEKADDEGAPSTRRRQKQRKATKQPAADGQPHVAAGQSETVVEVSGASAPGTVSARVTRSRRAQPGAIKAHASPLAALKQTGGRSTRQKRNMMAAQLGSPGMHPKSKTTMESGAVLPPAAASNVSGMTAAIMVDSAAESKHGSVRISAPGMDPGPAHTMTAVEQLPSTQDIDPGVAETTAAMEEPNMASLTHDTYTVSLSLTAVTEQHKAGQSKGRPNDMTRRPMDVGTTKPDAVKSMCEQSSEQERSLPALPGNAALGKQPIAAQPMIAPPDNVKRMGANIAATIAMFSGRGAPSLLGSDASDPSDNAGDTLDAKGTSDPTSNELVPQTVLAADPAKTTYSPEDVFSFGTKPKEPSSPTLPHFGPTVEQPSAAGEVRTEAVMPENTVGMKESPIDTEVPNVSEVDNAATTTAQDVKPSSRVQQAAKPELEVEVQTGAESSNADMADADDAFGAGSYNGETGQVQEASTHGDVRNRSLSLSLAIQSPIISAPPSVRDAQRTPAGDAQPDEITSEMETDNEAVQPQPAQVQSLSNAADDDLGPADQDAGLCGVSERQEQGSAEDAPLTEEFEHVQAGKAGEACKSDDGEVDELEGCRGSGTGARASNDPAVSVQTAVKADDVQSRLDGECSVAAAPVQLNKPKGSNLVSALRSFLPQRTAPSPPPAAGKKPVKVKALEAAQAAKQKEAVRQAERALARAAAVERQRPGQGDVGPGNTKPGTQLQGPARLTPTKSVRFTPTKSLKPIPTRAEGQRGTDAPADSAKTADIISSSIAVATSTAVPEEKRNDCPPSGAPANAAGSVLAKAAFFQLKEEQSRKATADLGAGRKVPVGTATGALVTMAQGASVPSYKSGANARVALAGGDNEAALPAVVATTVIPLSAANPNPPAAASSRGLNPAAAAAPTETVTDKHKRVEAKRREEEERRRAELEARTKAKDDKLRTIEASKQQQRQGGGGGAPRPPPPLIPNPFAVQPIGKRPLLNAPGPGAGPAGAVQLKPEAESNKVGPVGLSAAKTPGPKLGAAKTPGPKTGPVASSMVSPAVQMQIKLLPAVHAQGPTLDGTKTVGCAPGLPKPRPAGGAQAKLVQVAAFGAAAADSQAEKENNATPGAGDLTDEERRNVHAIQISPYVMQVKPRTPGAPSSAKPTYKDYEISPYRSDSDSNASEDEEETGRRRKPVPPWAAHEKVLLAVRAQSGINPDTIFGTYPSTIDLVKVFADMLPPGKVDARGRPRRDYRRRGSSGIWDADTS